MGKRYTKKEVIRKPLGLPPPPPVSSTVNKSVDEDINKQVDVLGSELQKKKKLNKRLDILLKKQKKFMQKGYELGDFKEPVLFLLRENGEVEFYEDVHGSFAFKHSNPEIGDIKIELPSSYMLRFPYGKYMYRGYIHFESEYHPYPTKPLLSAKNVNISIDKALNDLADFKSKELLARGEMWKSIAMGIALLIGMYILYTMVAPQSSQVAQPVIQVVTDQVKQNVSQTIQGGIVI